MLVQQTMTPARGLASSKEGAEWRDEGGDRMAIAVTVDKSNDSTK